MNEETRSMNMEQIEERAKAITTEIDTADAEKLDALNDELKALEERKAEIEVETRKADMKAVAEGAGTTIAKAPEKVIAAEREKLASFEDLLEKDKTRLAAIEAKLAK